MNMKVCRCVLVALFSGAVSAATVAQAAEGDSGVKVESKIGVRVLVGGQVGKIFGASTGNAFYGGLVGIYVAPYKARTFTNLGLIEYHAAILDSGINAEAYPNMEEYLGDMKYQSSVVTKSSYADLDLVSFGILTGISKTDNWSQAEVKARENDREFAYVPILASFQHNFSRYPKTRHVRTVMEHASEADSVWSYKMEQLYMAYRISAGMGVIVGSNETNAGGVPGIIRLGYVVGSRDAHFSILDVELGYQMVATKNENAGSLFIAWSGAFN